MPTEPRYAFSSCDYAAMDDHSREMLHQIVNAAGDRMRQEAVRTCNYRGPDAVPNRYGHPRIALSRCKEAAPCVTHGSAFGEMQRCSACGQWCRRTINMCPTCSWDQ